jgi:hypothetical protein
MKHLFSFLFVLSFSIAVGAQASPSPTAIPNFSGKWELDLAESQAILMGKLLDTKRGKSFQSTLTIDHNDPDIRIQTAIKEPHKDEFTSAYRFLTDGRLTDDSGKSESSHVRKGYWRGKKLFEDNLEILVKDKNSSLKLKSTKIFELSKNGKTLTVVDIFRDDGFSVKRVYHRGP